MHRRHRSSQSRRRDYAETPSVRSRSPVGGNGVRGEREPSWRHREDTPERSFTPPLASSSRRHEGSEAVHSLSHALLEGISQLIGSQPHKTGIVDKNIINEFNPLNQDIKEWLGAVDEYAYMNGWSDQMICHLALCKLRGPAEIWYRGLPTRLFTWSEWKNLLLEQFIPKRDLHSDMSKMLNCVPARNETLYEYAFEKLALINKMKIPLTDGDKVNLIMGGIQDEQIRFSVETSEISNPAKLARYLKIFDEKNNVSGHEPNFIPIKERRIPAKSNDISDVVRGKNNSVVLENRNHNYSSSLSKTCYRCRQTGHVKNQCPNKKFSGKEVVPYYHNSL